MSSKSPQQKQHTLILTQWKIAQNDYHVFLSFFKLSINARCYTILASISFNKTSEEL